MREMCIWADIKERVSRPYLHLVELTEHIYSLILLAISSDELSDGMVRILGVIAHGI